MREILFKAKRLDTGEWMEGYIHKCEGEFVISNNDGLGEFINAETLCQYTGLTDKNGHKIWENDVVSEVRRGFKGIIRFGPFEGQVLENIGFNIEWKKVISYREDFCYWADKCNVIGNIFDNPELLEV